jgi:RHS repeat-associated protein
VEQIAPDRSVYRPSFNESNLLEKVDLHLGGAAAATPFVTDIDYNAKGQRTLIEYGNGVRTTYEYDSFTFRLTRLTTTRPAGLNGLATQLFKNAGMVQDLNYTFDPAGNITRIADDALPTLFFANQQVDPIGLYTYDAVYRLVHAQGRESIGQSALQLGLPQANYRDYPYAGLGFQPFEPKAVRNYTERYEYDAVGNFLYMIHQAQNGDWRRDYRYDESSLVEPGKFSNRLSATVLHPNGSQPLNERYTHDAHGNMIAMSHLTLMEWDFKDQLRATARQVVNEGTPETTYYVYDATGQRVRKVTERRNGTRKNERIYLGGFEVFRAYDGGGTSVALERESLHVMDEQQRIALVETRTHGNDGSAAQIVRYQLANHLGSASLELDHAGQIISYEEYHPYGSTSYQAGRSAAEVSLKRYRYTGMERDEESGLAYHTARYYSPWLGRWTSADPIGIFDHPNLYLYARGNPVSLMDRGGQNPDKVADLERQLRAVREQLDKLGKQHEQLVERRAIQEAKIEISKSRIAEAKRSFTEAEIRQIEKGELKALEQGSGKRGIVKDLEKSQKKLEEASSALQKTKGELKALESAEKDVTKRMFKLVDKVQKAGGNPYVGTNDPALGHATAESAAEAEAAASSRVPVGGKKPPGGGGKRVKGGSGSSDPWAGGGRAAPAAEEVGAVGGQVARFGKTLKVLKFTGIAAAAVTGGIALGSALFHLYTGQYREAGMDVADFFTVGGASYATEKAGEAVQALDEGMKAARAMRDWNEGGGMPPPQPWNSTPEQRDKYYERQRESHMEHPFGF